MQPLRKWPRNELAFGPSSDSCLSIHTAKEHVHERVNMLPPHPSMQPSFPSPPSPRSVTHSSRCVASKASREAKSRGPGTCPAQGSSTHCQLSATRGMSTPCHDGAVSCHVMSYHKGRHTGATEMWEPDERSAQLYTVHCVVTHTAMHMVSKAHT